MNRQNCNYLSTGKTIYWPSDYNKLPDLLDFFIYKGITTNYIQIEPSHELQFDYTHTCNCNSKHLCDLQTNDTYTGYKQNELEPLSHIYRRSHKYEKKKKKKPRS
jgi:hypothetical protein